jgi:hypothetical protein
MENDVYVLRVMDMSSTEPEDKSSVLLQSRAGDFSLRPAAGLGGLDYRDYDELTDINLTRFMTTSTEDLVRDAVLPELEHWLKPAWLQRFEKMMEERRAIVPPERTVLEGDRPPSRAVYVKYEEAYP